MLAEAPAGRIVSAAVLLDHDHRWPDGTPALYLHNFVARCGCPGAGGRFLEEAEALAAARGRQYLRLDSAADNEALAAYYSAHGFAPAGTWSDGGYHGILRQKPVARGGGG